MTDRHLWRFMRWVRIPESENGCWDWLAATNNDGYGVFVINHRSYLAHRLAYRWFVGRLRRDLTIDHLCFNRRCVNPTHLEQVTARTNTRRAVARRNALAANNDTEHRA